MVLIDSSRDKAMFVLNLVGVLLGFLVVSVTSEGAVDLISTSFVLYFSFTFGVLCLMLSFICSLFVFSGSPGMSTHGIMFRFDVYKLFNSSFMFLILGLLFVLWFILSLLFANRFGLLVLVLLGLFILFVIGVIGNCGECERVL